MIQKSFGITLCLFSFLFVGCGKKSVAVISEENVLKIAVFADGRLAIAGKEATITHLKDQLQDLQKHHGTVWYYREAGQQEPPAIAMEVMRAIVDLKLPIRLSSRPDYSDYIDTEGRPHAT